jgi:hypothetical protein
LPIVGFSPQPLPARWRSSNPAGCQSMLGVRMKRIDMPMRKKQFDLC